MQTEFRIVERPSRTGSGAQTWLFYAREVPYREGYSMQMTALTLAAAEWLVERVGGKVIA